MSYAVYDVAVMNYPLFDHTISAEQVQKDIFTESEEDGFSVPVYIHIPFCDSLCDFCIYNRMQVNANHAIVERYVKALIKEIELYAAKPCMKKQKIGAVFFGGGTPSVLSEEQFKRIFTALRAGFDCNGCEITVECNPGSATRSKLQTLKSLGVTRISTGAQTFEDGARKQLNMRFTGKEIENWLCDAKQLGFKNVSVDLMFGLPGVGREKFLCDLEKAVCLGMNHISTYKLAALSNTKLYKDIKLKKSPPLPDAAEVETMFYLSHEYLINQNYFLQSSQEYNQEKNGALFWRLTYDGYGNNLSFGLNSFGYINGYCYANTGNLKQYLNKLDSGLLPMERISPKITRQQRLERAMILGFRGGFVSKKAFLNAFGNQIFNVFGPQIQYQKKEGLIFDTPEGYFLTAKGLYHQGYVSAEYMISIFKNSSSTKKKYCIGVHEMPVHKAREGDSD